MTEKKRVAAVILAAGSSRRMEGTIPKQFMELCGTVVFMHSVRAYDRYADLIVLVTGDEYVSLCREKLENAALSAEWKVVTGGRDRISSSMNGVLAAKGCDIVLIHDAARACVSDEVIENAIKIAGEKGCAVAAVPLKDTIKHADASGRVCETPSRSEYYIVQTPQAFRYEIIAGAYEKLAHSDADREAITDDSMAVERFTEHPVFLCRGSYENIKLTTPEDMAVAEAIIERHNN